MPCPHSTDSQPQIMQQSSKRQRTVRPQPYLLTTNQTIALHVSCQRNYTDCLCNNSFLMTDLGVAEGGDIRAAINACQFSTGAHPMGSSGSALTTPQTCCLKPRHHTCLVVRGCSNYSTQPFRVCYVCLFYESPVPLGYSRI